MTAAAAKAGANRKCCGWRNLVGPANCAAAAALWEAKGAELEKEVPAPWVSPAPARFLVSRAPARFLVVSSAGLAGGGRRRPGGAWARPLVRPV